MAKGLTIYNTKLLPLIYNAVPTEWGAELRHVSNSTQTTWHQATEVETKKTTSLIAAERTTETGCTAWSVPSTTKLSELNRVHHMWLLLLQM